MLRPGCGQSLAGAVRVIRARLGRTAPPTDIELGVAFSPGRCPPAGEPWSWKGTYVAVSQAGQDPGPDLAAMRESYSLAGLSESDLAPDWLTQFKAWLAEAVDSGIREPNAMVVATASPTGDVATRTVLCKGLDEAGIVFYTNLTSDKSRDLQANPRAAATFPWIALQRQVHFRGPVVRVSDETAQQYWDSRPRGSRIGAWASPQSTGSPRSRRAGAAAGQGVRALRRRGRPGIDRRRGHPAAAVLGRLAHPAGDRRVLAGPGRPAARPAAVPIRRCGRLDRRTARSVTEL